MSPFAEYQRFDSDKYFLKVGVIYILVPVEFLETKFVHQYYYVPVLKGWGAGKTIGPWGLSTLRHMETSGMAWSLRFKSPSGYVIVIDRRDKQYHHAHPPQ